MADVAGLAKAELERLQLRRGFGDGLCGHVVAFPRALSDGGQPGSHARDLLVYFGFSHREVVTGPVHLEIDGDVSRCRRPPAALVRVITFSFRVRLEGVTLETNHVVVAVSIIGILHVSFPFRHVYAARPD